VVLKKPEAFLAPDGSFPEPRAKRVNLGYALGTWVVFAERNNVPVLKDSVSMSRSFTAFYLDPFFVLQETNNRLKVQRCTEDNQPDGQGRIEVRSRDVGWIEKSDLVLWDRSLYGENEGSLVRRVFPKVTPQSLKEKGVSSFRFEIGRRKDSSRFFYVLKEKNNQLLISGAQYVGFPNQGKILGWFPRELFFEWDGISGLLLHRSDTFRISTLKKRTLKPNEFALLRPSERLLFLPKGLGSTYFIPWLELGSALASRPDFCTQTGNRLRFTDGPLDLGIFGMEVSEAELGFVPTSVTGISTFTMAALQSKLDMHMASPTSDGCESMFRSILGEFRPAWLLSPDVPRPTEAYRFLGNGFKSFLGKTVVFETDTASGQLRFCCHDFLSALHRYVNNRFPNLSPDFFESSKEYPMVLLPNSL
jgi:hypothetical protein